MIAPFRTRRVDSESGGDNWMSQTSPWAQTMVGLIAGSLSGRSGSSLSAFRGRNFVCVGLLVCGGPALLPPAHSPLQEALYFTGFLRVTLDDIYEEEGSFQFQMGRDAVHCGLWYGHPCSFHVFVCRGVWMTFHRQRCARPRSAPGGCSLWGQSTRTPGLRPLTGRPAAGSAWRPSRRTPAPQNPRRQRAEPKCYTSMAWAARERRMVSIRWSAGMRPCTARRGLAGETHTTNT